MPTKKTATSTASTASSAKRASGLRRASAPKAVKPAPRDWGVVVEATVGTHEAPAYVEGKPVVAGDQFIVARRDRAEFLAEQRQHVTVVRDATEEDWAEQSAMAREDSVSAENHAAAASTPE